MSTAKLPRYSLATVLLALLMVACLSDGVRAQEANVDAVAEIESDEDMGDLAGTIEDAAEDSGFTRNDAVIASLTIFVLAVFVGFEVITKVPPTLHTPLMSGSNAISGITIVGALIVAGTGSTGLAAWLGVLAIAFATINVVGGFLVTHRMLSMFKRK